MALLETSPQQVDGRQSDEDGARRFARAAMGTRFEILIEPPDSMPEAELRACAEQALDEIGELDRRLSLFRRDSFLSHINRRAAEHPVPLDEDLFDLLGTALAIEAESEGAFAITVAPLMSCWGLHEERLEAPSVAEIERGRTLAAAGVVRLDRARRTVSFVRPGVTIDLGGIAKGFALDRAAGVLREGGIECALLHGGTSTVVAIGAPARGDGWQVGVRDAARGEGDLAAIVTLRENALAVSAPHGRTAATPSGEAVGHLIDPRTGRPAEATALAAIVCPSATRADGYSTALLVGGAAQAAALASRAPAIRAALVMPAGPAARPTVVGPLEELFRVTTTEQEEIDEAIRRHQP